MKGTSVAALGLLIMSVVPMSLFAKWHTDKITIEGVGLTTPVEITSPEIGQFEVFAGPGTFGNGVEGREGFIINWSKGIVADRPGFSTIKCRSIRSFRESDPLIKSFMWCPMTMILR